MYVALRLVQPPYDSLDEAFSGEGAREVGGRWNPIGTPVVYMAQNHSLAALEKLTTITAEYRVLVLTFYRLECQPDPSVTQYTRDELPSDWDESPPSSHTQEIGHEWYERGNTLFLEVPSVVMPYEMNVLARPDIREHPDVTISDPLPYSFDQRVLAG